jgi:hypothetical protein
MSLRASRERRSARFDWEDGSSRVSVDFIDKGTSKSEVGVTHEKLSDRDEAAAMKAKWRERLAELKVRLESTPA